jgi:hypothetical protein
MLGQVGLMARDTHKPNNCQEEEREMNGTKKWFVVLAGCVLAVTMLAGCARRVGKKLP